MTLTQEDIDRIDALVDSTPIEELPSLPNPDFFKDPKTMSKAVDKMIDGETPDPPKPVEEYETMDYLGDAARGLAYGASKGFGEMYNMALRGANYVEEDMLGFTREEGIIDVDDEYEVEIDAPKTMAGQVTSGIGQVAVGMIPGLQIVRGATWATKAGMYGLSKLGITKGSTNLLADNVGRKAVSLGNNKVLKSMAESGAAGVVAEQLVFDPSDARLADLAANSDIPILKDIGEQLKYNEGDSEATARLKMAVEGLGIGVVFDGAIQGITLFGRVVKPKSIDEDPLAKKGKPMSIDALEELAGKTRIDESETGEISARSAQVIKETLNKQGKSTEYIDKYVGSINLHRINSGQGETYNLINETGIALRDNYLRDNPNGTWPPSKTNAQSLAEAAKLLGHKDTNGMLDVVSKNENTLRLQVGKNGEVVLGPGLEGATGYALAARQLLIDTSDVLFSLAREAKVLKAGGRESLSEYRQVKAAYTQQLLAYETIQNTVNGVSNEAGRILQSFNINIGNANKARYINDLVQSGGKDIDSLIDDMGKKEFIGNDMLQKRIALMEKGVRKNWLQKVKAGIGEYWYNSILSAIDTQVVNVAGNFGVQFARTVIEGGIGATRGNLRLLGAKMTGEDIDPSSVMVFGDVAQRLRSMGAKTGVGDLSQVQKDVLAGKQNPIVLDNMIMNVKKGKYGPDKDVKILDDPKKFDEIYKKEADAIIDSQGAAVSNSVKAGRLFLEILKKEMPVDPRYGKFEIAEQAGKEKAISIPVIGRAIRLPTTFMSAFDTAFKSVADNMAMYEQAYRMVRSYKYEVGKTKQFGPVTMELPNGKKVFYGEDNFTILGDKGVGDKGSPQNLTASEMIEYLVANPTPKMLENAEREFLEATFQQENWATKGGEAFRRILDKSGIGLGTALMPFVRTPLNLLAYSLDRTPIGLMSPSAFKNRKMLRKLEGVDQNKLTDDELVRYRQLIGDEKLIKEKRINRQVAGMVYMTGAYQLAQLGIINGGGPTDPTERKRMMETGWRPYSIKIGEEYYPISRLDPFSQIAALASDYQFITNELSNADLTPAEKDEAGVLAFYVVSQMAKNLSIMITDKTYLKSMGEIMDTVYSPRGNIIEKIMAASAKSGGSIIGGLIPNIVSRTAESFASVDENGNKQANMFYDPIIKDSYINMSALKLFVSKITSKIPGARKSLVDVFGEDLELFPRINEFGNHTNRERPSEIFSGTDNLSGPAYALTKIANTVVVTRPGTRKETAPLSAELLSLGVKEKRTDPYLKLPNTSKKVKLNSFLYYKRSMYEGERYREYLEETINSTEYQNLKQMGEGNKVANNLRKGLLENARKMAIEVTDAVMHSKEVYKLLKIDEGDIYDGIVNDQTTRERRFEVLMEEQEKLMGKARNLQ